MMNWYFDLTDKNSIKTKAMIGSICNLCIIVFSKEFLSENNAWSTPELHHVSPHATPYIICYVGM